MQSLSNSDLEQLVGGNSCHVNTVSSAVMVGAAAGFLAGGPVGAAAGAASLGGHAFLISLFACR